MRLAAFLLLGFATISSLAQCNFVKIAAGSHHTIALRSDSTVWSWGKNHHGQLGDGTTVDKHTPSYVLDSDSTGILDSIISIAAGGLHTVALKSDGTVWAWGENCAGQLGNDTSGGSWTDFDSGIDSKIPLQVLGPGGVGHLDSITEIAAAGIFMWAHTVALKSDGTVWAWGSNTHGQLGDGTTTQRRTPVQVVGPDSTGFLDSITAIAAGHFHTVALKSDSTVWAWGYNFCGQLGDGTTIERHTPVQVVGHDSMGFLDSIVAISAGYKFTAALKSDGTVWTWGSNFCGQLGDGTTIDRHTPVKVVGPDNIGFLDSIVAIAAGGWHMVALKADSTVWTWGDNGAGQLGDGTTIDRKTPVQVVGPGGVGHLGGIIAIAAGWGHTIAIKSDGTVWAWGLNNFGQLGDGTTTNRTTPVQIDCASLWIALGENIIPKKLLLTAYPNPFNYSCEIFVPQSADVKIYDFLGRLVFHAEPQSKVEESSNGFPATGNSYEIRRITWIPQNSLPSGVYIIEATVGERFCVTGKVVYLK